MHLLPNRAERLAHGFSVSESAAGQAITPENATRFGRYSVANAVKVATILECGCAPYVSVFSVPRWAAQGYGVKPGSRAIRVPVLMRRDLEDKDTGERRSVRVTRGIPLFCRCQVQRIGEVVADSRAPGPWAAFNAAIAPKAEQNDERPTLEAMEARAAKVYGKNWARLGISKGWGLPSITVDDRGILPGMVAWYRQHVGEPTREAETMRSSYGRARLTGNYSTRYPSVTMSGFGNLMAAARRDARKGKQAATGRIQEERTA